LDNKQKGILGEQAAVDFLQSKGYEILERNYRASHAEVDIIARHQNLLIFIEVKTRSHDYYGQPEEFVTRKKQEYMAFVASMYMQKHQYEGELRFDIIAIIMPRESVQQIKHMEDAFFPGLA